MVAVRLRLLYRTFLVLGLLALIIVPQLLALLSGTKWRDRIPQFFWRAILRICAVKVRVFGSIAPQCHLFVCNHASWFDIAPLGAVLPVCFVAKSEIKKWTGFNYLTYLQRTFFVDRRIGRHIKGEVSALYTRWHNGDNMLIFPESTTADGIQMHPFKTAFFAPLIDIAISAPDTVYVQPISLSYKMLNGIAMSRGARRRYAWLGEVSFFAHLGVFLSGAPLTIDLYFSPPLVVSANARLQSARLQNARAQGQERKMLAAACAGAVRQGLDALTIGANSENKEHRKNVVALADIDEALPDAAKVAKASAP